MHYKSSRGKPILPVFALRVSGWAMTIGRLGAIVGPLVCGAIMQLGLSFKQYFVLFAIPCLLLAVIALFFKVKAKDQSLEIGVTKSFANPMHIRNTPD